MTRPALPRLLRLPSSAGRVRPGLTVAAVAGIAGLMFAASAQLASGSSGLRHPTDLAELVGAEAQRVDQLTETVEALRLEVDDLAAAAPTGTTEDPALVRLEGMRVGSVPVTGPGLRVQLDDAPASNISIPNVTVDDLVVHQQDLQHVINALWAGGAEAMTLQGERVIMTSAFRCSGNILLLHGRVFSPPYVVEAVGDPTALRAALAASPGVQRYLGWVQVVGLGWSVRDVDALELPAYTGSTELRFAELPPGTDPLR
ncbi:protein of unknown function DUF881 [Xylanimonas cellulosilytica DSM 15894]|uniref:DUF881 domain-containing protein n=1 Tax=Xylanimonas cellulosilytica (strain DSM 15894 / JCM 12276 / CECT 5975 / KCTC 9989 / LMG 20990 / NBRC 107835 / XIL07) TaxID=446471 RepID=D1BTB3_XYLCX|nr:DUF881 domain-containing protein [Xylanimonas cellulosilytica]ACZ29055.1 protein of unknown function DUF881 [Xylanimonas cellulosilytica DSM 15894]